MKFEFKLSLWDYEEAERLHRSRNAGRQARFILFYRVVPVFSAVGLVLLGAYGPKAQTLPGWLMISFIATLLWVGISFVAAPRTRISRRLKQDAAAAAISISVDDQCVLIEVPGVSETKRVWKSFVDVARNDEVILLYTSKDCFLIFSTRAMSAEQQAELMATIERNLTRK
ncbi:MAG TPA: YcxB family protein [Terracidiphilus sp.]